MLDNMKKKIDRKEKIPWNWYMAELKVKMRKWKLYYYKFVVLVVFNNNNLESLIFKEVYPLEIEKWVWEKILEKLVSALIQVDITQIFLSYS